MRTVSVIYWPNKVFLVLAPSSSTVPPSPPVKIVDSRPEAAAARCLLFCSAALTSSALFSGGGGGGGGATGAAGLLKHIIYLLRVLSCGQRIARIFIKTAKRPLTQPSRYTQVNLVDSSIMTEFLICFN